MGEVLAGRYRVLRELGRGGMGVVYQVEDNGDGGRVLALKTIRTGDVITTQLALRFKEEFRSMAKLRHPNTVEVFDHGQIDDATWYITMEIVEGEELGRLVGSGMPLDRVYLVLIQLLQALGFIHSRRYVHRDIKAENIRVRPDGRVKLLDFGLMDQLGTQADGKITGTAGYLPPEVMKGGVINASSDLYSVGCLAYELLTGRQPFQGTLLEVLRAHVGQDPRPLAELRPDVPPRLARIVEKLLAKDQRGRYKDADEVIADLSDLAGLQVARPDQDQKQSYLTSSDLVGRDDERATLEAALAASREGEGTSIFVGAPAGVGKSRLVNEVVLQAKLDDRPVLRGQSREHGMAPFEPWGQIIRALVPLSTPEELQRHGPALLALAPDLAASGVPAPAAPAAKAQVHDALAGWLQAVTARTPVVLLLEDLHWADQATLGALNHVIRERSGCRLLVLGTFRNDEAPVGSPLWFTVEEGHTRYLKLAAFDQETTMLLVRTMLPGALLTADVESLLYRSTAGNAFFLTEVLRYLMQEGVLVRREGRWEFPTEVGDLALPLRVEDTILRRVAHLSEKARRLATTAAVIGRAQSPDVLLACGDLPEDDLFSAIDELIERQFLAKAADGYVFPHDRVREAFYEGAAEAERREVHARCGAFLERLHADHLDGVVNELARHFEHGEGGPKAFRYLCQAADQAKAAGMVFQAIVQWRKAERIIEGIELAGRDLKQQDLLWNIAFLGFQLVPAIALEAYEKLVGLLDASGNVERIGAFGKLAWTLKHRRPVVAVAGSRVRVPAAWARARQAISAPYRTNAAYMRIFMIYAGIMSGYGYTGQPAKVRQAFARIRRMVPTDSPLEGAVLLGKLCSLLPSGHLDDMRADLERASVLLRPEDARTHPGLFFIWLGGFSARVYGPYQGFVPDEDALREIVRLCDAHQLVPVKNFTVARKALWYVWSGRYAEAIELIEEVNQNCRAIGAPPHRMVLYMRPYLLWQRGELQEALALAQQALGYPEVQQDEFVRQLILVLQGRILCDLDEARGAQVLAETITVARERGLDLVLVQALIGRGAWALRTGDPGGARRDLEEALALASVGPARNPLQHAVALRHLAGVKVAERDLPGAEADLQAARRIVALPGVDNLIELGQVERDLAQLHLADGRVDEARAALQAAGEAFGRLRNRHLLGPVSDQLEQLAARRLTTPQRSTAGAATPEPAGSEAAIAQAAPTLMGAAPAPAAEALRTTLENYQAGSLHQAGLVDELLTKLATNLRLDSVCIVLPQAATPLKGFPGDAVPSINRDLVSRAVEAHESLCLIDLPTELEPGGSTSDLVCPSVAIVPLGEGDDRVLYCIRHDLESPLTEEDLPALQACAAVLDEALAALG